MQKLSVWLDENLLFLLASFLLIFIPLYPKKPLFDILPGYIVRVRLEDFFVIITWLVWWIWLFRGKIRLNNIPLFKPILAYLVIGLCSMFSAVLLTRSIPMESLHINKMVLHYFRRVEYFSLFFVFYSSIRNIKQIKIYLGILMLTILSVAIYGFGQKYLYWPAFSTMNREFSKGWALYLTEHARVLSTFGGHYDLAAFIMMSLILLWSIFFGIRNLILKIVTFIIISASFWTLILTASRTSFLAYIGGVTIMFFFWAFKKGLSWSVPRWFTVVFFSIIIMLSFGDLSERFTKLLRIDERLRNVKSLLFSPIGQPPSERALFLENNPDAVLSQITSKSDQPPSPRRPSDVYQDFPLEIPSTENGTVSITQRTYSKTAFTYDLSTAIRFDALWPMAIKGFVRNPILGSGYSSLNKTQFNQFTEAESTDNDYLRSLGETGLLGFITFYGTLLFVIFILWKNITAVKEPVFISLMMGVAGLYVGLLINAVYIDVFESSKVAFSFWAVSGFTLAGVQLLAKKEKHVARPSIPDFFEYSTKVKNTIINFIKSDACYLILILILAFSLRLYEIKSPVADWHSWRQADTSSVTRNYVKHGINVLFPTYDDLSSVASGIDNPKGLRFVEFPLYNLASVVIDKIFVGYTVEISGRLTNIFASLGTIILLFKLVRKYLGRKEAVLTSLFYAILPYNIFYNRVILPEPFMVFTSLGMLYCFDILIDNIWDINNVISKYRSSIYFIIIVILALVFTISSVLIKPFSVFLFLPMVYLWVRKLGLFNKKIIILITFFIICLIPFIWWRLWISNYPEGIPAYNWLFNGDGIRLKGAFFYWMFADRLSRLILGYWGLPLFIFGIKSGIKKEGWLFYLWGAGILLYTIVVATGNVRHDYYQIITIPIICIFLAKGVIYLLEQMKNRRTKIINYLLIIIMIVFMEMFGWYHIRDFYNINHREIVEAGNFVESNTKEKSLVIAPYEGDTAFLYQTRRAGWPIIQDSIESMISKGAQYYVSVKFDDLTKKLILEATITEIEKRKYKLIGQTDKYVLIQLVPDSNLPK